MFFALDESEEGNRKVLGGILLPDESVSEFEKEFASVRMKHKLFGEIKWTNIDKKYQQGYCDFVDLFLHNKEMTFHAVAYAKGDDKYKKIV